jgi:hypothetical protein
MAVRACLVSPLSGPGKHSRYDGRHYRLCTEESLSGIIAHLAQKHKGNLHDCDVVTVTASNQSECVRFSKTLLDLGTKKHFSGRLIRQMNGFAGISIVLECFQLIILSGRKRDKTVTRGTSYWKALWTGKRGLNWIFITSPLQPLNFMAILMSCCRKQFHSTCNGIIQMCLHI